MLLPGRPFLLRTLWGRIVPDINRPATCICWRGIHRGLFGYSRWTLTRRQEIRAPLRRLGKGLSEMKSSNASRFRAVSIAMDVEMKVGTLEAQTDPLSMVAMTRIVRGGRAKSRGLGGDSSRGPLPLPEERWINIREFNPGATWPTTRPEIPHKRGSHVVRTWPPFGSPPTLGSCLNGYSGPMAPLAIPSSPMGSATASQVPPMAPSREPLLGPARTGLASLDVYMPWGGASVSGVCCSSSRRSQTSLSHSLPPPWRPSSPSPA